MSDHEALALIRHGMRETGSPLANLPDAELRRRVLAVWRRAESD